TLYQGSKPVMWSPVEKTALAEAEVEYHDHTSHQVWVRFKVKGFRPDAIVPVSRGLTWKGDRHVNDLLSSDEMEKYAREFVNASVVIWTTTPWTIPQNRAVAYNPEITYGLYRVDALAENSSALGGELLFLADALADSVKTAAKIENWTRIREVDGSEFEGLVLAHPFRGVEGAGGEWDYDVLMLPGDHVTDDAGTGFVHTAPSHGDDDYQLGQKHGLPMTYNVEPDGSFRADLPLFGGQAIILPDGKEGPANVSVIK